MISDPTAAPRFRPTARARWFCGGAGGRPVVRPGRGAAAAQRAAVALLLVAVGAACDAGAPAAGGVPPGVALAADGGAVDGPGPAAVCAEIRPAAWLILEKNCAICHQAPAKQGNFDFCLDEHLLTSAVSSTGKRFVVPGAPEDSRLYQRVVAREMPPADRAQRPGPDDISLLRAWIAACVNGSRPPDAAASDVPAPDGPVATDGPDTPDGAGGGDGAPASTCGGPGQECCAGNRCNDAGCCVIGQCHAPGQACGDGISGFPGTCADGACVLPGGAACGATGQPCCGGTGCTATRAYCGSSRTCEICGALDQPCCGTGGGGTCLAGLDCQGDVFPNPGSCLPCGALNQPCCGNGVAALQTCNEALMCRFVPGMGTRCHAP